MNRSWSSVRSLLCYNKGKESDLSLTAARESETALECRVVRQMHPRGFNIGRNASAARITLDTRGQTQSVSIFLLPVRGQPGVSRPQQVWLARSIQTWYTSTEALVKIDEGRPDRSNADATFSDA